MEPLRPFVVINSICAYSRTQQDIAAAEFLSFGTVIDNSQDESPSFYNTNHPEIGINVATLPPALGRYTNTEVVVDITEKAIAHIHLVPADVVPWSLAQLSASMKKEMINGPGYRSVFRERISVRERLTARRSKKLKWKRVEEDWHFVIPGTSISIDDKPVILLCIRDVNPVTATSQKEIRDANEREMNDLCEEFGIALFTLLEEKTSSITVIPSTEGNEKTRKDLFEHLKELLANGAPSAQSTRARVMDERARVLDARKMVMEKDQGWLVSLMRRAGLSSPRN